jgi:phosphoribosylaminoimidazolecarboxamide formyltransferase/IMP cyclohydrolase
MALNVVREIDERVAVRHVLMSVSDKTGLETFVPGLVAACPGVRIYSTGGTYTAVQQILGSEQAAKHLVSVSDYTGQPEMQGGLVKTLDFKIYLGLLSEAYNDAHQKDLARTQAVALDMVVVNLYPFQKAVAQAGVTPEEARTHIDIGGPCMVRASAKNYLRVASVTDPADYGALLGELGAQGGTLGLDTRFCLMRKAFAHTAHYDAAIAAYFACVEEERIRSTYRVHGAP